jgi:hypothetical protein
MDPWLKALLNSLRCPICKAQIDTKPSSLDIFYRQFNYSCAYDYTHYAININTGIAVPTLESEHVNVFDSKHKYSILKTYPVIGKSKIEIRIYDVDAEGRINFTFKEKKFTTDLDLFDFKKFDSVKAVNRIKTVLVFQ